MAKYLPRPAVSGLEILAVKNILSTTALTDEKPHDMGSIRRNLDHNGLFGSPFCQPLSFRGHHDNSGLAFLSWMNTTSVSNRTDIFFLGLVTRQVRKPIELLG